MTPVSVAASIFSLSKLSHLTDCCKARHCNQDCLSHTAILISWGLVLANNYHLSVSTAVGLGS
jgi:hypothetical protein